MTHSLTSKADLNRVAALGSGRGGRPRSIEPEDVVAAAIVVLSREGFGALTMRRIAQDLGVGVSTIHNAAGSKEELLQAVADAVLSRLPSQPLDLDQPVEALTRYLLDIHHLLLANPAVVQMSVIAPMRNRSVFWMQEQITRALTACGLDGPTVVSAYSTISGWLFGYTLSQIAAGAPERRNMVADLDTDEFPTLRALIPHLAAHTADEQFREGLDRILDGFLRQGS